MNFRVLTFFKNIDIQVMREYIPDMTGSYCDTMYIHVNSRIIKKGGGCLQGDGHLQCIYLGGHGIILCQFIELVAAKNVHGILRW